MIPKGNCGELLVQGTDVGWWQACGKGQWEAMIGFKVRARIWVVITSLGFLPLVGGCNVRSPESFGASAVQIHQVSESREVSAEALTDRLESVMTDWFGTPDKPRWPTAEKLTGGGIDQASLLVSLVDPKQLERAAGPVRRLEDRVEYGLYRKHCAHCHGISGDGWGATAGNLSPYPRDFRRGTFKFKSTPVGSRPTRSDLMAVLKRGIPGTSMPSFASLSESKHFRDDYEPLIDYVIYLSVRGEVERRLIGALGESGEEGWEAALPADQKSTAPDAPAAVAREVAEVLRRWRQASQEVLEVPENELADRSIEDLWSSPERPQLLAAIERGEKLFGMPATACTSCHGLSGRGDGRVVDYDEWTKDWTIRAGVDPTDRSQWKRWSRLGVGKPVPDRPRDLHAGVYRGGASPQDLYRRIAGGIDGSPMPALPLKPANPQGWTPQDVWDVVHFVRWLPYSKQFTRESAAQPATSGATAIRASGDQPSIALSLGQPARSHTIDDGRSIAGIESGSDHPAVQKEIP